MATDRWEGDSIHFIDYTPETVRTLLPDMDGCVVAEAFVYNDAGHSLGLICGVSALDLKRGITTKAAAIETARKELAALVNKAKPEAAKLTESRIFLHAWNGHSLRPIPLN